VQGQEPRRRDHQLLPRLGASDDQTLAAGMLRTAGLGNIRTTTMRAFRAEEMKSVIGKQQ
jgi:uncharacterized protein with GYD domain